MWALTYQYIGPESKSKCTLAPHQPSGTYSRARMWEGPEQASAVPQAESPQTQLLALPPNCPAPGRRSGAFLPLYLAPRPLAPAGDEGWMSCMCSCGCRADDRRWRSRPLHPPCIRSPAPMLPASHEPTPHDPLSAMLSGVKHSAQWLGTCSLCFRPEQSGKSTCPYCQGRAKDLCAP